MKNNKITMNDFCKLVGKTEEEIKNGYLYLRGTGITQLPDNRYVEISNSFTWS